MKRSAAVKRLTDAALRAWPLPDPQRSDSKDDRGQVLVVGGSRQIPGAVLLSATAALRAGAGKLQIATDAAVAENLALSMPEAKVIGFSARRRGMVGKPDSELLKAAAECDAMLIGPGMDISPSTSRFTEALIASSRTTVVLDAAALHAHGCCRDSASVAVLTPHMGEMASLLDSTVEAVAAEPEAVARDFAAATRAVVVLKGPTTYIASPQGHLWIHKGGSVGLGTSGSGDVLAGVVAGLAARGASAMQSAVWAVFLHARAGALLERRFGPVGFLAREIAGEIPALMARLSSRA